MREHFKLLGLKVRDVVTGFEGVCETVAFDLYGCVQAVVRPEVSKEKPTEVPDGRWFDLKRLVAVSSGPVIAIPSFADVLGGSDKPAHANSPTK